MPERRRLGKLKARGNVKPGRHKAERAASCKVSQETGIEKYKARIK